MAVITNSLFPYFKEKNDENTVFLYEHDLRVKKLTNIINSLPVAAHIQDIPLKANRVRFSRSLVRCVFPLLLYILVAIFVLELATMCQSSGQ